MNTTISFSPGWSVIYTRPRHEKKVQKDLEGKKILSFLPCMKTQRTWNDRKKNISVPMFPSYVFVYIQSSLDYYSTLEVDSALFFLKLGKQVAKVDDGIIDNIKMLTESACDFEVSTDQFFPGQSFLIKNGLFSGYKCEFIKLNGSYKLIVRLELMQRCLLVTLSKDDLVTVQ